METLSKSDRINKGLKAMGIHSLYGVINHFPRRYDNFEVTPREGYIDKARIALYGKVVSPLLLKNTPRIKIVSFDVETEDREARESRCCRHIADVHLRMVCNQLAGVFQT